MTVMEEYLENNSRSTDSKIFQYFQANSLRLSTTNTVYIPSGVDGTTSVKTRDEMAFSDGQK